MRLHTGPVTSLFKAGIVPPRSWALCILALGCIMVISATLPGQNRGEQPKPPSNMQKKETRQRLRQYRWWPTRGDASRQDYAGSEACAACHASEFASQTATSMAHAAERAAESQVLRSIPLLSTQPGSDPSPYQTTIRREAHGSEYTVARGGYAMRGQLLWALGAGIMGQTYSVEAGGNLYEGHRTYFTESKGLDQTPGQSDKPTQTMEEAFGLRLSTDEAAACLACHTMQSTLKGQFDPYHAVPGVS